MSYSKSKNSEDKDTKNTTVSNATAFFKGMGHSGYQHNKMGMIWQHLGIKFVTHRVHKDGSGHFHHTEW